GCLDSRNFDLTHRLESAVASCTPFQPASLKPLSPSFPMSVTNPTLKFFVQVDAAGPLLPPQLARTRAPTTASGIRIFRTRFPSFFSPMPARARGVFTDGYSFTITAGLPAALRIANVWP